MRTEAEILEKITVLENHTPLSYSKAGWVSQPDLFEKQTKLTSTLDGLYFCLGKTRPKYACDRCRPPRF